MEYPKLNIEITDPLDIDCLVAEGKASARLYIDSETKCVVAYQIVVDDRELPIREVAPPNVAPKRSLDKGALERTRAEFPKLGSGK